MPEAHPPGPREMGYYLSLAQVGLEMVAPLIVGLVIDSYADTRPWFTLAGMVLGFVGGLAHIVVLSKKHDAATRQDQRRSNPP
jgi:F0F1-type ATP synthase assembly protein I